MSTPTKYSQQAKATSLGGTSIVGTSLVNLLAWTMLLAVPFVLVVESVMASHMALSYVYYGFLASFALSLLLVRTEKYHAPWSADHQIGAIQKVHEVPVARVGGAAILPIILGLALVVDPYFSKLVLCGLPVFIAGLVEDITKKVSVFARLVASLLSGLLAAVWLDVSLTGLGVPSVDWLFAFAVVSWPFTAFAVAGVVNSINIIDGFNGLASGVVCLLAIALAVIAHQQGDHALAMFSVMVGSVALGFSTLNYFTGRIFLGDGGAYLFGFLLASLAVLMVVRNPTVSPWVLFMVFSYPVNEVLVSMLRRKLRKVSTNQPDRDHLHHRIYSGVLRYNPQASSKVAVNSAVSKWIWLYVWFTFGIIYLTREYLTGWGGLLLGVLTVLVYCATYIAAKYFTDRHSLL